MSSSFSARTAKSAALVLLVASVATSDASGAGRAAPTVQRADQALVSTAKGLDACRTSGRSCRDQHRRLQDAGARLGAADRRTAPVARKAVLAAPAVTVSSGKTLRWSAVRGATRYIVVAKVAGKPDSFDVVRSRKLTPSVAAARTVTYRVRTVAVGSAWSVAKRVVHPGASSPTASDGASDAPATSPAPVGPAPSPVAAASHNGPGPRIGVVVGSAIAWQLQFATKLGARSARMEFAISTPVSEMAPIIESYAKAGIEANLLAGFPGRMPTAAEIANLGKWAAAFGRGGTFWQGKSYPASLAVDRIEFGNESSGPWHYAALNGVQDWPHSPTYAALAEEYGRTFRDAAITLRDTNPSVRLLAVGDVPGRELTWMDGMFRAVPNLGDYIGGWSVHPYGPSGQANVDDVLRQARSHGASDSIPLYITETGLASDDGGCLTDNAGWDRCLSYAAAARTLTSSVDGLIARYGDRLKEVDLYSAGDLRDHGASDDREVYFGALTATAGTKGAYTDAARAILARTT